MSIEQDSDRDNELAQTFQEVIPANHPAWQVMDAEEAYRLGWACATASGPCDRDDPTVFTLSPQQAQALSSWTLVFACRERKDLAEAFHRGGFEGYMFLRHLYHESEHREQ